MICSEGLGITAMRRLPAAAASVRTCGKNLFIVAIGCFGTRSGPAAASAGFPAIRCDWRSHCCVVTGRCLASSSTVVAGGGLCHIH